MTYDPDAAPWAKVWEKVKPKKGTKDNQKTPPKRGHLAGGSLYVLRTLPSSILHRHLATLTSLVLGGPRTIARRIEGMPQPLGTTLACARSGVKWELSTI